MSLGRSVSPFRVHLLDSCPRTPSFFNERIIVDVVIIEHHNINQFVFAVDVPKTRKELGSAFLGSNRLDIDSLVQLVGSKDYSKGRVSVGAFELLGDKLGKGMNIEVEVTGSVNLFSFSWNRMSLLDAFQMLNVGRNAINRKVIHSFIKSYMRSDLDSLSINIIPKNVPSGVRHKSQENSLLGIIFELSAALGRRTHPDTSSSKKFENQKSISLLGGELKRRELNLEIQGHWKSGDGDKRHQNLTSKLAPERKARTASPTYR